jgi:parallel beta-helix repeat protein
MDGKWNIVERNIIQHAMLINSDGAALKSFGVGSQYNIFRNNFVSSSNGNTAGAPQGSPLSYFQTPGIYFDFSTNNCTIQDNTIYNQTKKGIFLNASTNHNTVVGNTVYGGNYLLDFNGAPNDNIAFYINMIGMTVKHNVLFAKDNDDYVLRMVDNTGGYNHGIIDSNYYFQPYEANNYAFIPPATSISFSTWLTNTGYDMHTQSSFLNWALPTSDDTLIMNQTDNVVTVSLGADKYLDLDSNTVCGSVTLAPYTSKILIHTNTLCSIGNVTEPELDLRLSVYPNPFTFATTIKCSEAVSGTSINIYNTCGKLVKQIQDFHGDSFVFNRGELPNGLYMIELSGTSKGLIRNKMLIID